MSDEEDIDPSPTSLTTDHVSAESLEKARTAIESLSHILSSVPSSLSSSANPALSLLQDPSVATQICGLLRRPTAGAGDDTLCRWLYDTYQAGDPSLQLAVLRFVPVVAGAYLLNAGAYLAGASLPRRSLAGFEAVLLAIYAHETAARHGQTVTVNIPDLSHSSIYHETKQSLKNSSTELNLAVISPSLEPHGTIRSTRRARIVGVALELYFSKISEMPIDSKIDFCEFCKIWAGQDGEMYKNGLEEMEGDDGCEETEDGNVEELGREVKEGRIPLPRELLQPVLRILGHCLMGPTNKEEETSKGSLHEAACVACRALYARALHDINPSAILATGSLLRLAKMAIESERDGFDPTEIQFNAVINI